MCSVVTGLCLLGQAEVYVQRCCGRSASVFVNKVVLITHLFTVLLQTAVLTSYFLEKTSVVFCETSKIFQCLTHETYVFFSLNDKCYFLW